MTKKKQQLQPVNKPIYRYWQALYMSFYSSRLYIDVSKRWRGFGIVYLLLVMMLASIPLSTRIIIDFNHYFDEKMIFPLASLPPLYIQNGEMTSDKKLPYLIKNKQGKVVAIVDNTGAINGMSRAYPDLTLLITKHKILFRPPRLELFPNVSPNPAEGQTYTYSLDKTDNEVFSGKAWTQSSGLLKLKIITELLVYPVMVLFVFSLYSVFLLVLAMFGQFVSHLFFGVKLGFKESCRVLSVAATPQIILFFLMLATNIMFGGLGLLYMILVSLYFCFAVLSIKRERNKMVLL